MVTRLGYQNAMTRHHIPNLHVVVLETGSVVRAIDLAKREPVVNQQG